MSLGDLIRPQRYPRASAYDPESFDAIVSVDAFESFALLAARKNA